MQKLLQVARIPSLSTLLFPMHPPTPSLCGPEIPLEPHVHKQTHSRACAVLETTFPSYFLLANTEKGGEKYNAQGECT